MAKRKTASKKTASKKASPKKKAAAKKKPAKAKASKSKPSEANATIDRRRKSSRREELATATVAESTEKAPKLERRKKVNRRRQIDPTTCERDYSDQEVEFMNALDDYKRTSGRMFPTCSEVLEVIRSLGYAQLSPAELAARNARAELENPSLAEEGSNAQADRDEQLDTDAELGAIEAQALSESVRDDAEPVDA